MLHLHSGKLAYNVALDIIKVLTSSNMDSTCLHLSQLDVFWCVSLRDLGDCYPLHILCLSPAPFRLTEVVLIILMLIRNRVRRLAQFYEMLPVAVDAWPFLFLFFIAQIRAAILLLHKLTWPVLQLFKTHSNLAPGNLICPWNSVRSSFYCLCGCFSQESTSNISPGVVTSITVRT